MSRRNIPAILGKGGDFQELGHCPLSDLSGGPWNGRGACGYVIQHAKVLHQTCTEAQGRLEINLSTILNLVGFNQFMSCPRALSFF